MSDNWSIDRFRDAFVGLDVGDQEESDVKSVDADSIISGNSEAIRKVQTFKDKVELLKTSLRDEDELEPLRQIQQETDEVKNTLKEAVQETHQNNTDLFEKESQPVDTEEVVEEVTEKETEEKIEDCKEDNGIIEDREFKAKDTDPQDKDMSIKFNDLDIKNDSPWLLTSPSVRFDHFYQNKKSTINRISHGGILPFDNWNEELRKAYVDVTAAELYDLEFIQRKMQQVQKWRDRIQEILLKTNTQYFLWKRAIDLLHGALAGTQYEKPAERQKGVIFQHLGDMEFYFADLEALKENVHSVMRNLEGAFECLSRQLTVAQDKNRIPSKYENDNPSPNEKYFNKSMAEQFDSLEPKEQEDVSLGTNTGVRKKGWDEILKK